MNGPGRGTWLGMDGQPRIESLDRRACVELLARATVGRLVFSVPPEPPGVVPVTYVLDGHGGEQSVVLRTAQGSRLGRAAVGAPVSFEVDDIHEATHEGWSVVVTGTATCVTDETEVARLADRLTSWAPGFTDLFVRVPLERVTGRRLRTQERVIQLPETPAPRWPEQSGWSRATRTAAEFQNDFDGR